MGGSAGGAFRKAGVVGGDSGLDHKRIFAARVLPVGKAGVGASVAGIARFGISPHRPRAKPWPGAGETGRILGTEGAEGGDAGAAQRFAGTCAEPVDAGNPRERIFLFPGLGGGGGPEPKADATVESVP